MLSRTSWLYHERSHRRAEKLVLHHILKQVSRSFYLSMRVLPETIRKPVSLAYLFCRAADTIADTQLFPRSQRLQMLHILRRQFCDCPAIDDLQYLRTAMRTQHGAMGDSQLLSHLPDCLALFVRLTANDRQLIRDLVLTLTYGMEMDLTYFPGDTASTAQALPDLATLDLYTYYVAGVVGEFWTKIHTEHMPAWRPQDLQALCALGVRFGKGLQMTNILKDLGKDIAAGRCYLPQEQLDQFQVSIEELTQPGSIRRLRPLIVQLAWQTLEHLDQAAHYVLQLPRDALRLRLGCMWPLLFALQTLELVCRSEVLLAPDTRIKISRGAVYSTMFVSCWCLMSPRIFTAYYTHLRQRLTAALYHAGRHRGP